MKRLITLTTIAILFSLVSNAQFYVKGGLGLSTEPNSNLIVDAEMGIHNHGNTIGHETSIGMLFNSGSNKDILNMKYGVVVKNKFKFYAGLAVINQHYRDYDHGYTGGIIGMEVINRTKQNWGRIYYGVDFVDNQLYVKAGLRFWLK